MTYAPGPSSTVGQNTCTTDLSWLWVARTAINDLRAQQDEAELATLLALLDQVVRPRTVLEIGSAHGGSLWAWSQLPSVQNIISVSLPCPEAQNCWPTIEPRPIQLVGNSAELRMYGLVKDMLGPERPGLVFIDGDHTAEACRRDLDLYGPLAARGGLVVLHDTQDFPGRADHQVSQVWAEARQNRPSLELISTPGGPCGTGILFA